MSNLFNDRDISNITPKEMDAIKTILQSNRGGVIAREIICTMSDMDKDATTFFLGLIPKITTIQVNKLNEHVRTMRGTMSSLGRRLSCDRFTSGYAKGTPKFLTQKYVESLELSAWEMLEYIQEFANFQEFAYEVKLGTRSELPKASVVCECDELKLSYVLRFCKFLDDLETKSIDKLVSGQVFACNPNLNNMILWHKEHRSEWDDVSDGFKQTPISRHESLADDLCDNGDG